MAHTEMSLEDAWSMLSSEDAATLIDVRTTAEWNFVGVPDLAAIGKEVRLVEWSRFPDGSANERFVEEATADLTADQPLLLLCRSGARSRAAAQVLEAAGFPRVYNVTAGFEGDLDTDSHRHGGWKERLPWRQS